MCLHKVLKSLATQPKETNAAKSIQLELSLKVLYASLCVSIWLACEVQACSMRGGSHADEHPSFTHCAQLLCKRVGAIELDHVDWCIGLQKLEKFCFVDDSPVRTLSLERDNLHKDVPLSQSTHT